MWCVKECVSYYQMGVAYKFLIPDKKNKWTTVDVEEYMEELNDEKLEETEDKKSSPICYSNGSFMSDIDSQIVMNVIHTLKKHPLLSKLERTRDFFGAYQLRVRDSSFYRDKQKYIQMTKEASNYMKNHPKLKRVIKQLNKLTNNCTMYPKEVVQYHKMLEKYGNGVDERLKRLFSIAVEHGLGIQTL